MNRVDLDWAYIRRYTMRPALCAFASLACLGVALWFHDGQKQLYYELTANHDAVHKDYDALVKQRRLVDRYHRYYQRFHELGFIGRESRLDWVETLRMASETLSIPRLSYAIEPQMAVVAPANLVQGGKYFQVRASELQLDLGLVHEIKLLQFFDVLQSKAPGLINVDQCALEFSRESTDPNTENLAATCIVKIFSVITSDVDGEAL